MPRNQGSVGSNLDYWRKYQQEPKVGLAKKNAEVLQARMVQSGVDPEEGINVFRGMLICIGIALVICGGIALWRLYA